ncbi:MAG TPA: hypothetical protein VKZ18_28795 [Polyangia bacterium]|nr:hypothetical protein [Polyangia bacterium]
MIGTRMYDRRERASSTRWVAWMPLLFVAAFLYWSVALGLGGLSLMAASAISSGDLVPSADLAPPSIEPAPGHTAELDNSIVVHLEESDEPEDVNDNVGAVGLTDTSDDDGTSRLPGQSPN